MGESVGASVGESVGVAVGANVGLFVGASVPVTESVYTGQLKPSLLPVVVLVSRTGPVMVRVTGIDVSAAHEVCVFVAVPAWFLQVVGRPPSIRETTEARVIP